MSSMAAVANPPAGAPLNGIDSVLADHELFKKLFNQYREAPHDPADIRIGVIDRMVREVAAHASAEERTIYPLVLSKLAGVLYGNARAVFDRMTMDDQVNKQLLDWLHRHKPESSADWPIYHDTVLKFISVEEEHLGIEEQTVLEPLRKVMDEQELEALWSAFDAAKKNAPLLPHPGAPASGLAAKVVHPLTGFLERTIDSVKEALHVGGKPHEVPPMPAEAEVKPSVPSAQVLQEKEEERRSSVQG